MHNDNERERERGGGRAPTTIVCAINLICSCNLFLSCLATRRVSTSLQNRPIKSKVTGRAKVGVVSGVMVTVRGYRPDEDGLFSSSSTASGSYKIKMLIKNIIIAFIIIVS